MRFQSLIARLALAALVLGSAIAALAVIAVRTGAMDFAAARTVMIPSVALGLAALGLSLAWAASALKHNKAQAKRTGLVALAGSVLLLMPPLGALYGTLASPPIHDVATDPDDAPQFSALLMQRGPDANPPAFDNRIITWRGETGPVSYILHTFYGTNSANPLTKPMAAISPPHRVFWRGFEAAKKLGWHMVAWDEKSGRIEATSASFWFGQISDIAIRVRPAGAMGARLDIRAQTRIGMVDFGRNLALIKAYRRRINSH